jgi:Spy/CpxP family protein refolding chaperone
MKTQTKPLLTLVAGGLLLGSAAVMAFGGGHDFKRGACEHGSPMHALQQLDNVSDEQRKALRDLFEAQRKGMREQRDALHEGRKALREAMRNGANNDEIRVLAEKQGERVSAMIMTGAALQQNMAAILNAEQMQQLRDFQHGDRERKDNHHRW